jgi:hypothetical protein
MKALVKFSLVSFVLLTLAGCNKYNTNYNSLDDISTKEYYHGDILPDSLQYLYSQWNLFNTSGGFTGIGCGLEFDNLVLKKNGIFGITKGESLIAYGKLVIFKREHSTSIIFMPIKTANIELCRDTEKYIQFNNDTLDLIGPCCDRINFRFIRKK